MGKLKSLLLAVGIATCAFAGMVVVPIILTLGSVLGAGILVYFLSEDYRKNKAITTKPNLHLVDDD